MNETPTNRVHVLTGAGAAAIGVVRAVGPAVGSFADTCLSQQPAIGRYRHADLIDGERVIDDVLAVRLTEDVLELHLHGGPWVVQAAVDLLNRHGFASVQASNGPLPAGALDDGSPLQQEVMSHLPMAATELGLRTLLNQESAWRKLAEMDAVDADRLEAIANHRGLHWLLHPPAVAIVGLPNAGKSTLANQLFGQQRSITADVPGTTRDWVGATANIDGLAVTLLDTPGQHASDDAIEQRAIGQSRERIASADLVVLVLDSQVEPYRQQPLIDAHPGALLVVNKADEPTTHAIPAAIPTIATTGQGISLLCGAIRQRFDLEPFNPADCHCWTDRQRALLRAVATGAKPLNALNSDV